MRHIFERFCGLGSCLKVARELNEQGHRTKAWAARNGNQHGGNFWSKVNVHNLLRNRRYRGEVVYKDQAYPGEHKAIIDQRTWDRVQSILKQNAHSRASQTRKKTAALLKGILRCGHCGGAMGPSFTTRRGKHYHYYVCHTAGKKGYDVCLVPSVAAGTIEGAVFEYLQQLFAAPEMVAATYRQMHVQTGRRREGLRRERKNLERKLSDLRKAIGRLVRATDGKAGGALADELRDLNAEVAEVEQRVLEVDAELNGQDDLPTEQDIADALRAIEPVWAELFPAEKERIVRLLVETVTLRPDGLTVRLRPTGLITLAAEVAPDTELVEAVA